MLKKLRKEAQVLVHFSVNRLISKTEEIGSNLANEKKPAKDRQNLKISSWTWRKMILEKTIFQSANAMEQLFGH